MESVLYSKIIDSNVHIVTCIDVYDYGLSDIQ